MRVFLTHPSLRNGLTVDDTTIAWGHSEDFENYSTVYLAHELLHIATAHDPSDVTHAIIELATDNETRIRLNGKGEYFEHPGHSYLVEIEKFLSPFWKAYLESGRKDFSDFIEESKKRWHEATGNQAEGS